MDGIIVYTVDDERFWRSLLSAAARRRAVVHGSPPEVAIELDEARLYVTETGPGDDVPPLASRLGEMLREVVVDIHNPPIAEEFLAEVLDGLDAVIDDDHGDVVGGAEFVDRVCKRSAGQAADRRRAPPS